MPRAGVLVSLAAASLAAAVFAACGGPTSPDVIVDPIHIDSVDVVVGARIPATVEVHVRGVVGDGCSTARPEQQTRAGNTVTITILRQRPRDAVCSQLARLYDERFALDGTFPPGSYLVVVNNLERGFPVP